MPRIHWARRALGLAVASTVGVIGAFLLASPASAHDAAATAEMSCQQDGSVLVTWTIQNDYNLPAEVSNLIGHPAAADLASSSLAANGSTTATQTVDASGGVAGISYNVTWSDGYSKDKEATVTVPADQCTPSPSPSVESPAPSPSTAAPVPSSEAPGAGGGSGSLPVTGSPLTALVGVAAALLVGGAVLFVLARRRRTSATGQ